MAPNKQQSVVKATKKSAFSCEPCRTRKVKCGGEHPTCNRCTARNEKCVYKLSPTLTYTKKLETRIAELESALRHQPHVTPVATETSPATLTASPHSNQADDHANVFGAHLRGLSFDAKGSITYQGPTSLFQLPSRPDDPAKLRPANEAGAGKQKLIQNAWEQRALEGFAETPEPFNFLLSSHWCWIQPIFSFVYRPAFTRDMQRMGQYYSHTLLNAILGHSSRWCRREPEIRQLLEPYQGGELFKRHARTLLFQEISSGNCSIPTIQTMLLLSAQECGAGNRTQAWLYSGMAFRLLEDMGIVFDTQRYAAGGILLSDEDIEIRRRLFWSCYFWDKIISLYLGRSPSLSQTPVSPPQIIMDDSAEDEYWEPHGLKYPEGQQYPPSKAHSVSCFTQMCRLSAILNEVLLHIYSPIQSKTEQEVEDCLIREGFAMRQWWQDLPHFLRIDAQDLPTHCPPSHIATLNCLFHTCKILLHRPMLTKKTELSDDQGGPDTTHIKECLSSANSILAIFDLFVRTFGYSRVVLSIAYSVYTAASIFLLQIQASPNRKDNILQSMRFCIQALDKLKDSNPVIGGALKLVLKALSDADIDPNTLLDQNRAVIIPHSPSSMRAPSTPGFTLPDPPVFDTDGLNFTPEMFETIASLEPITAAVG